MPAERCCCCFESSGGWCSRALVVFLLVSAVPLAVIFSLERSASGIRYRSGGWIRECAKWDSEGRRFLISTFLDGGVVELPDPSSSGDGYPEEMPAIQDPDVAGNSSLGIAIDRTRGRLLVVYTDLLGLRFSAVAAYDLSSWRRIFLSRLSGPDDEDSMADDVAVDGEGNAYITDAKANKIWKVSLNGELLSIIRNKIFTQRKEWYHNFVALNGIVYHPNGYLLVVHTASGHLFKVNIASEEVKLVRVSGSLLMGDGLELFSPTKLVVAGSLSGRIVESSDDWETARVTERYIGPLHRIASSATVKDGKIYLNHLVGVGLKKKTHILAEAVFLPMSSK